MIKELNVSNMNLKHLREILQAHSETTQQAHKIANRLIKDLEVQSGFGLASFLEVDTNFDNFTAVRVWTQRKIGKLPIEDIDYDMLKANFFEFVPESV